MRLMNLNAGCIELEATDESGVVFRFDSKVSTIEPGEIFTRESTGAVVGLRLTDEASISMEFTPTRQQRRLFFRMVTGRPWRDKRRWRNEGKARGMVMCDLERRLFPRSVRR